MKGPIRLAHKARSHLFRVSPQIQMSDPIKKSETLRCCRLFHVRTLAIVIALLEVTFLLYQSVAAISHMLSPPSSHQGLSIMVFTLAVLVACVAVSLLFVGIFCHVPVLLIPHMLMQVLFVLTLLGMASFTVYTLCAGTSVQLRIAVVGMDDDVTQQSLLNSSSFNLSIVSGFLTGLLILMVVAYFAAALINIWCFNVVMDCYRWLGFRLEEKSRALGRNDIPISRLDGKPPVAVIHATDF
ncbi:hypothetical protein V3C99_005096 [Haemonchus contortus]